MLRSTFQRPGRAKNSLLPADEYIAIDTETTGLDVHYGARPFFVSMCDHTGTTYSWEWDVNIETRIPKIPRADLTEIRKTLRNYKYVVFHNAKFDMRMLNVIGIFIPWHFVHDTLLASHIMNSDEPHGLKKLAAKYAGITDSDEEDLKDAVRSARRFVRTLGFETEEDVKADYWLPMAAHKEAKRQGEGLNAASSFALEKPDYTRNYATQDAVRTSLLWGMYVDFLNKDNIARRCYKRERDLLSVVYAMESNGLNILPENLTKQINHCRITCEQLANKIILFAASHGFHTAGTDNFNLRSTHDLRALFYEKLQLPITVLTPKGKGSTSAEALEYLSFSQEDGATKDMLENLLKYRSLDTSLKYLRSYQDQMIRLKHRGGRQNYYVKETIYPRYNPTGTRTTRFTSSNPNAQNISKKHDNPIRKVFGPPPSHVWYCMDYDQVELRVFALASKEPYLMDCFAKCEDVHQMTANLFGVDRQQGKTINFAIIYGAGAKEISRMTGIPGSSLYNQYKETYKEAAKYMRDLQRQAVDTGKVRTLFGYPLRVNQERPYIALNYVVQGTAGDLLKNAMLDIHHYIYMQNQEDKIRLTLSVHDELIFEVHQRTAMRHIWRIRDLMGNAGKPIGLVCPVSVSKVITDWSSKTELVRK